VNERSRPAANGPATTLNTDQPSLHPLSDQTLDDTRPCDFCGDQLPAPTPVFVAESFARTVAGGPHAVLYGGIWRACPACAPLVRAASWRKLADRVLPKFFAANPVREVDKPMIRSELIATWLQMWQGLRGEVVA
jgi:hypothetical protein